MPVTREKKAKTEAPKEKDAKPAKEKAAKAVSEASSKKSVKKETASKATKKTLKETVPAKPKADKSAEPVPVKEFKEKESQEGHSEELYQVGDYLVYPNHGVGQITAISNKNILGKRKNYYILEVSSNKMTVMVPVENAREIGVRPIIRKKDVRKVLDILKKDEVDTEEDWKIRYQNNLNKIKSGSIYSVAEVCRNLYKRAKDKELSLMERRLYEQAFSLIASELALSKEVDEEEAKDIISEVLSQTPA